MPARELRLQVFRQLLGSVSRVNYSEYDSCFNLIDANDMQNQDIFRYFFLIERVNEINSHGQAMEPETVDKKPILFTNSVGMTFLADWTTEEGAIERIYLLGPVFLDDRSFSLLDHQAYSADFSADMITRFRELVKGIPIVPFNRILEYGIMLHCAITEETVTISDIYLSEADVRKNAGKPRYPKETFDLHSAYLVEKRFLKLVEEGNLSYRAMENELRRFAPSVKYSATDRMRQAKVAVITLSTLCSRAAIRGGLSAEVAFTLNDRYIRALETATNVESLWEIKDTMVEDFVRRVHRNRTREGVSPQIRTSCDYISTHLGEPLDIHTLAERLGYTDYYFSSKFKKETGVSVRDFITEQKMEQAKDLLANSSQDVLSICLSLGYSSQSHFGSLFKKATGMTPGEYRASFRK